MARFKKCVYVLLQAGASANAATTAGWTPAHFACETGQVCQQSNLSLLSCTPSPVVIYYGEHANVHQSHSQNDSGDLRGVAGGDGELGCLCGKAICVMAPPIHLGAWSMAMAAF